MTETVDRLGTWIDLSSWPIRDVTAIRYPVGSAMTDLPAAAWLWAPSRRPVRILPVVYGWGIGMQPAGAALPVEIDVQAGFEPGDVPADILQAMHLLVAHWWANRSAGEVGARAAAIEIPFGVEALLQRWRLVRV